MQCKWALTSLPCIDKHNRHKSQGLITQGTNRQLGRTVLSHCRRKLALHPEYQNSLGGCVLPKHF